MSRKIKKNTTNIEETPREIQRGVSSFVGISQQDSDLHSRFGKNLKSFRERAGLTQEELSQIVPMDRAYLAEVEAGKKRISLSKAYRIANALNTSLNDLVS